MKGLPNGRERFENSQRKRKDERFDVVGGALTLFDARMVYMKHKQKWQKKAKPIQYQAFSEMF